MSALCSVKAGTLFDSDLNHKYLVFRRTKIIATIGPASNSPAKIEQLLKKGLNVVRINFSHGIAADHLKTITHIRAISHKLGRSVAIVGDLCGPKIRVGKFVNDGVVLKDNALVSITTQSVVGTESLIPSHYKRLYQEVSVGEHILLDDGNLELKVIGKSNGIVKAKVIHGGLLKNNKGMNLPDTKLNISALTEKDKKDVLVCLKADVDYIALSFVRKAHDIVELKTLLKRHKSDIKIIAKIEKPEALDNINEILRVADAIMVARGDLGVELPPKKVPLIQSKLIQLANAFGKPVIVATQMLESMIEHSRPTRAEVTDVSGACMAGADAVMLSGETAVGKYPVETFEMMDSILRETEAYQFFALGGRFTKPSNSPSNTVEGALGIATAQLSRDLMVHSILVLTRSGNTARIISSDRPAAPIVALTQSLRVEQRLNLNWGVYPHHFTKELDINQYLVYGEQIIKKLHLAKRGEFILMLSGLGDANAATNSIIVHQLT